MVDNPKYYLGLDLSTQQLKAAVIETVCDRRSSAESYPPPLVKTLIVCEENVIFDRLGFGTTSGVYCKGPYTVVAPTRMWIVALDMLLNKLRSKVDLSRVLCIGGCAQQHGTVYWGDAAKLREMSPLRSLQENLEGAFTVLDSPIWMDSSTTRECRAMEAAVGGAQRLAQLTGSRAYERFSGPQIARIARQLPCQYQRTQRISLVSSFLSSIFIGDIAPIDVSDASGMNLMDVRTNSWSYTCVRACFAQNPPEKRDEAARDLLNKLGNAAGLIPSGADLGSVSKYMQSRFGFGAHCHVAAFTGDNAASFSSLCGNPNIMVLSMGSSDTLLLWAEKNQPGLLQGHLMVNPLDPTRLMMMLCFKNGSLMRDNIVKELAEDHWARFNELLGFTPPGNLGKVGVYYDYPEILPERHGRYRFDVSGPEPILVERPFAPEEEVRALIEGQFMCKRLYIERLQSTAKFRGDFSNLLFVTGGASANTALCQVLADVFNMQVRTISNASISSAALGGVFLAYRCANATLYQQNTDLFQIESKIVAEPRNSVIYEKLLPKFKYCLERYDLL